MKHLYVTLFDKGFTNRGLALHASLIRYAPQPFQLYILCVDEESHALLTKLALPRVTLVSRVEFEQKEPAIAATKKTRTLEEYCWTLGSGFTQHVMKNYTDPGDASQLVIYVDADLYFYSSVQPIFDLFGNNSTLIIPHNHPENRRHKEKDVGKYNVGMVIFRNDDDGRACLTWWSDKCIEWCYARVEPDRFGDQKYLDFFEEKFKGVYILTHKGSNLAPWCIGNFKDKIYRKNGVVMIDDVPLIFFHFSSFKIYFLPSPFRVSIAKTAHNYGKPTFIKRLIYNQYRNELYKAMKTIRMIQPDFIAGTIQRTGISDELKTVAFPLWWWAFKDLIRPFLQPIINIFRPRKAV
ncbi:MAG: hypothetical protein AAB365_00660 [Patescibacteria group bacterium]